MFILRKIGRNDEISFPWRNANSPAVPIKSSVKVRIITTLEACDVCAARYCLGVMKSSEVPFALVSVEHRNKLGN